MFQRKHAATLRERMREPRRFIQVVAGPRQVGKTTMVEQTLSDIEIPSVYLSADEPSLRDKAWLASGWERGRILAAKSSAGAILALDEIQKIPDWSETVKRLWDEDSSSGLPLKVILLGSAPLIIHHGLSDSLTGRFEVIRLSHWSFPEMRKAFDFSLEQYIFFGGYPGAASLISNLERWRSYLLNSLVETTISRDDKHYVIGASGRPCYVSTGLITGDKAEIIDGLREGDLIYGY